MLFSECLTLLTISPQLGEHPLLRSPHWPGNCCVHPHLNCTPPHAWATVEGTRPVFNLPFSCLVSPHLTFHRSRCLVPQSRWATRTEGRVSEMHGWGRSYLGKRHLVSGHVGIIPTCVALTGRCLSPWEHPLCHPHVHCIPRQKPSGLLLYPCDFRCLCQGSLKFPGT